MRKRCDLSVYVQHVLAPGEIFCRNTRAKPTLSFRVASVPTAAIPSMSTACLRYYLAYDIAKDRRPDEVASELRNVDLDKGLF